MAWPAAEVPLVIAAVGVALAVGTGMAVLVDEISQRTFTWRQLVASVLVASTCLGTLPFVSSLADGRFELPTRDWDRSLAWMRSDVATEGHFRVLWAGRPDDLPGDPQLTYGELAYTLSRDGALDARDLYPAGGLGVDAADRGCPRSRHRWPHDPGRAPAGPHGRALHRHPRRVSSGRRAAA